MCYMWKKSSSPCNNHIFIYVTFLYYFLGKTERPSSATKTSSDERGPEFFTVFMEPTSRPKYHNLEIKKSKAPFESKNWPDDSECVGQSTIFNEARQYVPVHLPPENKGYAWVFQFSTRWTAITKKAPCVSDDQDASVRERADRHRSGQGALASVVSAYLPNARYIRSEKHTAVVVDSGRQ